jgi:hypothetical protein
MSDDNVIPFPVGEIRNPLVDPGAPSEMDIASDALYSVLVSLIDNGFDPRNDPKMQEDLGLVLNILYAIISRAEGKKHFMHDALDEMSNILSELKKELENDNH